MPARRSLGAVAGPSAPAAQPQVVELHPITKRLRKMWKFAAVCQFLFVFDEAFGMSGFETETLESDFEDNEANVVPDLIKRLLYTLTLDRSITLDNWQDHLRTQYNLRDTDSQARFGTVEQPVEWAQLSLEDKIGTLHDLCEWQLMDPERFRKLVKSEEDVTTWRVSPIGWDAHDNAYWLFDDNRIWIQRPEPLPKPAVKARPPAKKGTKRARTEAAAARRAASSAAKSSPAPKASGTKRNRPSDATPVSTPSKRTRSSATSTPSKPPPRRGTRTSARFAPLDGEGDTKPSSDNGADDDSDLSDSDLSDLPDTTNDESNGASLDVKMETVGTDEAAEEAAAEEEEEEEAEQEDERPADDEEQEEWIEFETIVVTRQQWLDFAKRFAKSKDPNEKNLHQFINNEILDQVLAAMDEIERQRAMEQALANRKRSSRIAMKESEREERERDREARVRMEEKMATIRQEEENQRQKEVEEHEAQRARENRLREREERLRARELEIETRAIREEEERERREHEREVRKRRREEIIANGGVPPPSKDSTPVPEDGSMHPVNGQDEEDEVWELNCEVCGKAAISPPDEDDEIVCCEQCNVWQHIKCWDSFDKLVLGLKKRRDWDSVDFFCSRCRPPSQGTPAPYPGILAQRSKSSPRSNQRGASRSSNGSDSPVRNADGADSPRQRIKLVSGHKGTGAANALTAAELEASSVATTDVQLAKPPIVPSQALPAPPSGAKPAETGILTSSGAATSRPSPAVAPVGQLPPPSSHALPSSSEATTSGRPLLPSAKVDEVSARGDPTKPAAASTGSTNGAAASNGAASSGLGMGRPTQPPHFSAVGSPQSPSSASVSSPNAGGSGAGGGLLSPRSPSYGAGLGSPGYRRPSQPSGSFPMRHTPAKSPLSRPYDASSHRDDAPANGFSLGPPRATSPSAARGATSLASLGATAKSLHPSSAAVPPVPAKALGDVVSAAFAAPSIGASAPSVPATGPGSAAQADHASPSRLQSSALSPGTLKGKGEPGGQTSDLDVSKTASAAEKALHTLENGLNGVSQPEHGEGDAERRSASPVKVVELPPTHVETS